MHILRPIWYWPVTTLFILLLGVVDGWPLWLVVITGLITGTLWRRFVDQWKAYRSNYGEAMLYKAVRGQTLDMIKSLTVDSGLTVLRSYSDTQRSLVIQRTTLFGLTVALIAERIVDGDCESRENDYIFLPLYNLVKKESETAAPRRTYATTEELQKLLSKMQLSYVSS